MIYANAGSIRDPLKQDLALDFYRKQNKYISILTETLIKHDQILHVRNNWLGHIFLSPGISHTKRFIAQLRPGFEGVTEVDTDPKGRFVSFKVTLSNNRVLYVCAPKIHNTREQLVKGRFFERLQNYMENKCEGKKTKLSLESLILLRIKWTGMVETKRKGFIDVVPKAQDLQSYKIC